MIPRPHPLIFQFVVPGVHSLGVAVVAPPRGTALHPRGLTASPSRSNAAASNPLPLQHMPRAFYLSVLQHAAQIRREYS
jgi:hypothetical protein